MSRRHRHRRKANAEVNLGFQIAPMIDVVFVILLFFIVSASDIQVENAHVTKLPGTVETQSDTPTPDEIAVTIEDDGQVSLNDDPLDTPEAKLLPELASNLSQLRESSAASKSEVLVTIYANELARYERVVDVLDALSRAKITNVSFQAGSPE
ncbi:MAG: biopolymer transporter ExbD [Akkermansiaceae bacterium]|jgi:biopolymer transport protein ExbD|nr:biopolymer transporter ExbD [Akkermansiaceae bacterium]